MTPRGWLWPLCVFLFAWEPLKHAGELSAAAGTVPMRGPAAAAVQSLYWSVLPRDTLPGDRMPLAAAAIAHPAAWIVYLRKSRRVRAAYD